MTQTASDSTLVTDKIAQAQGLEAKLTEAAQILEKTLRTQGPEAYQTALDIIWYQAVGDIATGVLCLLLAPILGHATFKFFKWADEARNGIGWGVLGVYSGAFSLLSAITSGFHLLNYWTWVALLNPEIALAYRVLQQTGTLG